MAENNVRVKNRLVDLACYTALVVVAVLLLVENLLPIFIKNFNVTQTAWYAVLKTIKDIAVLVGIAAGAYKFSKNTRNIVFKIVYFVAIVIYIIGIILLFVGNNG